LSGASGGHSEACHFPNSSFSYTGVTLMLKISWLATFANALAGLFGKSEGMNWN
jgi:hypothetical protein